MVTTHTTKRLGFHSLLLISCVFGAVCEDTRALFSPSYLNASLLQERGGLGRAGTDLASLLLQAVPLTSNFVVLADSVHEGTAGQLQRVLYNAGMSVTTFAFSPQLTRLIEVLKSPTGVSRRHYVITLCSDDNLLQLFTQVRQLSLQSLRVSWVLMTNKNMSHQLDKLLKEGTQVVLLVREMDTFNLFSTKVQTNGEVRFLRTGTWIPDSIPSRARALSFSSFEDPYRDFGGRELVVAANDNWPFFGISQGVDGQLRPSSGIDVSIMEALKRALNFTYRVVSPADGKWGGPQPDGTVTGLIGLVARQEADLAICEITITGSRESVVDFTWPYYLESVTLVSRAPAPKQKTFAVLWPFTLQVWLCIIFSTLSMGPVVKMVILVLNHLPGAETPSRPLQVFSFNMFRSLVVQGNLVQAYRWPHRFIFFCWFLFCFYIYALYSGTLTAVLAVPAFEQPINRLEDLPKARMNGYTIGTIQDSSLEFIFKEAKGGIYQEVWQLFDHTDRARSFLPHPDLGFDKILADKFVFVNPELNSKIRAAQRGRAKFYFARQTFYPQGYGIACYSGAPFINIFNQMLGRMISAGLINKWAQDEVQKVSTMNTATRSVAGPAAIALEHLQAAFFILLLGFLASALVLMVEIIAVKI